MEGFMFVNGLHPLILIAQEVVAFFQRSIWDEDDEGEEGDDAGAGAEVDMQINQHVEEDEDPYLQSPLKVVMM